jgi:hypothetical protein
MEGTMLTNEQNELIKYLSNPHRVSNPNALFKFCEEAAELITELDKKLDQSQAKRPKKTKT